MAGRLRIAKSIREVIHANGRYESATMPSILSHRSLRRLSDDLTTFLSALVRGSPMPLQCILFGAKIDVEAMCQRIPRDGVIYLDGIRLFVLAQRLRAERPTQRIVVDLDDLLSRRADLLLRGGQPLSTGYLTEQFSPILRVIISRFSRWILTYERATLRRVERRVLEIADAAVLLSEVDSGALRYVAGPNLSKRIHTIPPSVAPVRPAPPKFDRVERFVFVGTDGLTQNRLTIDHLINMWRRHRPQTPLVLFGKQWRSLRLPDGVSAAGYVGDLSEIYDPQSVLLTPSFIGGGIKTKVLEAFAHRIPVVGNSDTFESLALPDYPLAFDEVDLLVDLVLHPDRFGPSLRQGAEQGFACVQSRYTPEIFGDRWLDVLALPRRSGHASPDRRVAG